MNHESWCIMRSRMLFIKLFSRSVHGYSTKTNVRVRFAPSPTGLLHLGGLRTALYNFLYARSHRGVFILRIEDTDQTRLVPGATLQLIEDLRWVGLCPDEGPTFGGDHGPYVQSERIHLYREEAEKLVRLQAAYYCFCSEHRLDILRKDALRSKKVPKYDNYCRHLSADEVRAKISSGAPRCVRFKLVPSEPFKDLVYGEINHEVHEIEGDPIILKSDGWPTYHLANVVDDHFMKISHVIRGVEWMQSTNKHLMIYKALGYEVPAFAHLPLLLNTDGSKLSKRQGDLTVKTLRENGILPRALVNFVLQAGSGFDSQVKSTSSLEDLVSNFQMDKISTSSCRLPFSKLPHFNRDELGRRVEDTNEMKHLVSDVRALVEQSFSGMQDVELVIPDERYVSNILKWCLPRISKLDDLVSDNFKFLWMCPKGSSLENIDAGLLDAVEGRLVHCSFQQKDLVSTLKTLAEERQMKYKDLMIVLRTVLSGLKVGPGVVEMLVTFGKDLSLERLRRAKSILSSSRKSVDFRK